MHERQYGGALKLLAPAKINLYLEVLGKRPDGYHSLRSYLAPISLFDEIELVKVHKVGSVKTISSGRDVPLDGGDNLCSRAAAFFFRESGVEGGVRILLKKVIPIGAGLGGGSSDAAATIMGLERLFNCALSEQSLEKAAFEVGADVPFFFSRSAAWIEGVGEKVCPAPIEQPVWLVVVHPACVLSTRFVFSKFTMGLTSKERTHTMMHLTFQGILKGLRNDLQLTVGNIEEKVALALDVLRNVGALASCMSGSGSAVFGLFADRGSAFDAAAEIKTYPYARNWWVEAATTLPSGAFPFTD